jgi:hypothetical protein
MSRRFWPKMYTFESIKGVCEEENVKDGSFLLGYIPRVELCCVIGLLGLLRQRTKATHSYQRHGCASYPSSLPCHAGRVDVVDVWA